MFNITKEQAISMLPDSEHIHVQMNPGYGMLIGADWNKKDVLDHIEQHDCEVGGEMCRKMNHGLVVWFEGKDNRPMFVETKSGFDFTPFLTPSTND